MGIKISDLSYIKEKEILKNINMQIDNSEIYTILGFGKTTLLNIITNNIKDFNGSVKNSFKNISYIKENIEKHFININLKKEMKLFKNKNNIDKVLEILNIDKEFLNKNVFNEDYMDMKKSALFLGIIKKSDLIVFDEPFYGLSKTDKEEMVKIIKKIKKEFNIPIIITSNDTESIHKVSDYIYVIDKEIIIEGNKYDVFKEKELLNKHGIVIPKIIEFSSEVLDKKKIKMGYRDDINDLIKDIYRYAK